MWNPFRRNSGGRGKTLADYEKESYELNQDYQITAAYDTVDTGDYAEGADHEDIFYAVFGNNELQEQNVSHETLAAQHSFVTEPIEQAVDQAAQSPALPVKPVKSVNPVKLEIEPEELIDDKEIIAGWRREISEIGGKNGLLYFEDTQANRIELSAAHPSGTAQFIAGQKTLLSSLIRDNIALRRAKQAASRVTDKAIEMRNMRGLETVHLGIGIVQWRSDGVDFCAPLLLRPLAIRRYGHDFEIKLKSLTAVNPELIRALRKQFGIALDACTLIELAQQEGVFKPQPVIDRLRQMVAGVADFSVQPRLVVSSFGSVAYEMQHDLGERIDSTVLRAVSGDSVATKKLRRDYRPVNPISPNNRAPETDRSLYDSDFEQDDVIAQIAAGHSLVVHTLPGTGATQTVVNALGELVWAGKRVLVVSPRYATIDGISHRLNRVGLEGLLTTPRRLRRSLIEGIRRNEASEPVDSADIGQALLRIRQVLIDHRQALSAIDPELGVSAIQAMRELVKLARLENPPQTEVRLSDNALLSLAMERSAVAEALTEVARLGQFEYGPADSPWYGVSFNSTEDARRIYNLAVDAAETKLPRLVTLSGQMLKDLALRPYNSVHELGIYLNLLNGIGRTLDRFNPEVYDRPLTELITAHAPHTPDEVMTKANKKRLKKLAQEYVRPGVHVTDMYAQLTAIQKQRQMWQRYCTVPGARPEVPLGLSAVATAFTTLQQDLESLDAVLLPETDAAKMMQLPIDALKQRLVLLAEPSEILKNIQERTAIVEKMREAELDELLTDLSARHVHADQVATELEQAWWKTALSRMLETNLDLRGGDTAVVERLAIDFRLVDEAYTSRNGAHLAAKLADAWHIALLDNKAEAERLHSALHRDRATAEMLCEQAPNIMNALTRVWAVSPYEAHLLPDNLFFDTVLLVDAAAFSLVEAVGAIRRAAQVVAFGDPVIQNPSRFNIAVTKAEYSGISLPAEVAAGQSAYDALQQVLPRLKLTRSYRAGGADLTSLVNIKFYNGEIATLPWAGTFLGRSSLTLDFVRQGQGELDRQTVTVESTAAEVARVVELVLEHAAERPGESLMVITASRKHAVRAWQAVLAEFAKHPQHRDFILGEHAEPFTVVTLEEAAALSRDRVIFSIGFGRTPHGKVLSNFGMLSTPDGDRLIAVAMTRARRGMVIVSCFSFEQLEGIREHGVEQLAAVLGSETSVEIPEAQMPAEIDPMILELADLLEKMGLRVVVNYQHAIPIAAALGDRAIAVDIDFSGDEDSLRHVLRLRPAVLRRLGWHYQRVQSFDMLQNPYAVAAKIAEIIGYEEGVTNAGAAGVADADNDVAGAVDAGSGNAGVGVTDAAETSAADNPDNDTAAAQ
ncbi:AAA family ATPase [Canibacter sp. lx-45]|uniref:AAA family ATPase n=1 Tax=Canibacter zhuwentaonis TaxID=2837491 RepID=UPI001BDD12F7|nr:AAA family ATPase [Canibacter zhuwentaonis]MBT1035427.1 AAA family ATPase [Canibacter zhuwentaonis]